MADGRYHWAYGSDELYAVAGLPLPPAQRYDDFEQVENGVGSVRYLQQQITGFRRDLAGLRIGVLTGTAMGRLMPDVLTDLAATTDGSFELMPLENTLFGPTVTTAGLLPGQGFVQALKDRTDLDLALIPGEALNDASRFIDDMSFQEFTSQIGITVYASLHFTDALKVVGR